MRRFGCDLSCQHLDAFGCYILRMFIPDPIKLVRRLLQSITMKDLVLELVNEKLQELEKKGLLPKGK